MTFLAPALGTGLFGIGGLVAKALGVGGKKKARPVLEPRPVQRDLEREAVADADALLRRKGAAADLITGTRGAEASAGSIGRLVVGS